MPRVRFRLLLAAPVALAIGCGSTANFDDDVQPGSDTGGIPGSDTGIGGGDSAPGDTLLATVCKAKVDLVVKKPVAQLRDKGAMSIALTLADDGSAKGDHPLDVGVFDKDGTQMTSLFSGKKSLGSASFDFVPSSVTALVPGKYTVRAKLGCPTEATNATPAKQESTVWVLRIGAKALNVEKGTGARVPLMYHAVNHAFKAYYSIPDAAPASAMAIPSGEPELDTPAGVARNFADLWTTLDSPMVDGSGAVIETGTTSPIALTIGSKPDLVFTMGKTAAGGAGNVPTGLELEGAPQLRVALDDTAALTGDAGVIKSGVATLSLAASPVPAIQKADLTLKWHFEAKVTGGDWFTVGGTNQTAAVRIYGVLGNTQGTAAPNIPWVAVVDDATTAIAGGATDENGARSILVKHVYEDLKLTYDRKSGASHYCGATTSDGYSAEIFHLSSFLTRRYGNIVNCSDCASILSTYANMIGAKLHYAIIGWGFGLNPIMGIGSTTFGSPFDSGRFSFSYHAVTTPNATANIFDATLAVDGDSDPATDPHVKELVQNLTGDDYLKRLSTGGASYKYADQITTVD